ncbi:hypothetical protein NUU61_000252 [Penicillium alfredii]|uniref:U6 snRNA phosphodiesterase n=1 Tax=Penicillium alfredii TaxID=1506179 RepID=A0A9W9KQW5_9EURO|nr:uncharacterized protein NUU61_000252 [Penicillium alfredii]KAJ5114493.1 hypothetical protein NUU61_000252 [Penicillium alfredii]
MADARAENTPHQDLPHQLPQHRVQFMSFVQYSESESEADTPSPRPAKKPRPNQPSSLPPLPAAFHDLYASSTRVSVRDDPSLHGGRKRVIPHVEGNWPTHLYLEWYPSKGELPLLADLIAQAEDQHDQKAEIHSLLHSDLGAQLPLHISLSRPVVLRTEQRALFTETLQNTIRDSHISPFEVVPDSLDWVSNYEQTRWFLVLRVRKPANDGLNRLLRVSNDSLALFDQPPLYQDPRPSRASARGQDSGLCPDSSHYFHISLAWNLSDPSSSARDRVASTDLRPLRELRVRFSSVKAKIGNHVASIPLPTAVPDGGLRGL